MINITVKADYIRVETAKNSYLIKATTNNRFTITYLYKTSRVSFNCSATEHRAIVDVIMYSPDTVDEFFAKMSDEYSEQGKKRLLEILNSTKIEN